MVVIVASSLSLLVGRKLSDESNQSASGRTGRVGVFEIHMGILDVSSVGLPTFGVVECSVPPKCPLTVHPETLEGNTSVKATNSEAPGDTKAEERTEQGFCFPTCEGT